MTGFVADWTRLERILTTDDVKVAMDLVGKLRVLSGPLAAATAVERVQCYATLNTWFASGQDDGDENRAQFLLAFGAGAAAWEDLLAVLTEVAARFDKLRWPYEPAALEVVDDLGVHQTVVVVTP